MHTSHVHKHYCLNVWSSWSLPCMVRGGVCICMRALELQGAAGRVTRADRWQCMHAICCAADIRQNTPDIRRVKVQNVCRMKLFNLFCLDVGSSWLIAGNSIPLTRPAPRPRSQSCWCVTKGGCIGPPHPDCTASGAKGWWKLRDHSSCAASY